MISDGSGRLGRVVLFHFVVHDGLPLGKVVKPLDGTLDCGLHVVMRIELVVPLVACDTVEEKVVPERLVSVEELVASLGNKFVDSGGHHLDVFSGSIGCLLGRGVRAEDQHDVEGLGFHDVYHRFSEHFLVVASLGVMGRVSVLVSKSDQNGQRLELLVAVPQGPDRHLVSEVLCRLLGGPLLLGVSFVLEVNFGVPE